MNPRNGRTRALTVTAVATLLALTAACSSKAKDDDGEIGRAHV